MKSIFKHVTIYNFVKYVAIQFAMFHIFYTTLNGGEGPVSDIRSWIPAIVFATMFVIVCICEIIRKQN